MRVSLIGKSRKVHCFIVDAKCIDQYDGYETFVMKFLKYSQLNKGIRFHVAYKANGDKHMDITKLMGAKKISENEFEYCGAKAFMLHVPEKLGPAQAVYYDITTPKECCHYRGKSDKKHSFIYVGVSY